MAQNLIPKINLSEAEQAKLVRRLRQMIEEAEEFHHEWADQKEQYFNAYRCIPKQAEKLFPWKGAFNIFLPLTRVITDGYLAQEWDAMLANEPFLGVRPVEGSDQPTAYSIEDFYNYKIFGELIPFRNTANDFLFDNTLDGTAALKVRWARDHFLKRHPLLDMKPVTKTAKSEFLGVPVEAKMIDHIDEFWNERVTEERQNYPAIDNTDLARLFIAPDTKSSLQWPDCRWYFQEQYLTADDLIERRRQKYDNIDDKLLGMLQEYEPTDRERLVRRSEGVSESKTIESARVLEFYMRWPLSCEITSKDGKTISQDSDSEDALHEEVIVTYLADTEKISRVVPLWRIAPDGKRPHVDTRFRRLPRFFYGMGIAAKMHQLNKWINADVNQMMNFGTLQNAPFYFYAPSVSGLMPDITSIVPGQGIPVQDPRGVVMPHFQGDHSFWLSAMNVIQTWAERDGGINDLTLGRQPSMPNAPRTARGQMLMREMGNIGFSRDVSMHTGPFEEVFRRIHERIRRYGDDEIPFIVPNTDGKSFRRVVMPRSELDRDVQFQFKLNPNRLQEQQVAMQKFQLLLQSLPLALQNPMLYRPLRAATKEVYETIGRGTAKFDEIWPEEMVPNIQTQPPGMIPPTNGGMGGIGQVLQGLIKPAEPVSDEEMGVNLQ